ncbi:hypothetical protein bas20_0026 [Escherichia phage FritzHoffmann]|nr:hypothetical protein bas20_0026 [Escherichia phage FritzHoffmann]
MKLISCKEAKEKGLKRYFTGKPCKKAGHVCERQVYDWKCVKCVREEQRVAYENNPDKFKESVESYRNQPGVREKLRLKDRERYSKDPAMYRCESSLQRCKRLKRVPAWSETEEIKEFYKNCPEGYEVDHIIPLQGDLVSGLHVLANLQYLPMLENRSKGNRYNV